MENIILISIISILLIVLLFYIISLSKPNIFKKNKHKRPIVDTHWLNSNIDNKKLYIIDIRPKERYGINHIKNSVNIPFDASFSAWTTAKNNLIMEIPEITELYKTFGEYGINKDSHIVIVSANSEPPFELANANRVAIILIYAGIENISILDGGYTKWISEKRETTTEIPKIKQLEYFCKINKNIFASTSEIYRKLHSSIILDCRDLNIYLGDMVEPWVKEKGHIANSKPLPAPLIWNTDGTYKTAKELRNLLYEVVEKNNSKEIIVSCGVGGYSSSWWYVLNKILGVQNVKIHSGSIQEWVKYYKLVKD